MRRSPCATGPERARRPARRRTPTTSTGDLTLAELVARVLERHPGDRMARTVAVCSVLVGDQPVRSQDPDTVLVAPGSVVELLPPFAGG